MDAKNDKNMPNPSATDIGREFVRQYYKKRSFHPNEIYLFYGNEAVVSYDGHEAIGQADIQKAVNYFGNTKCAVRIHSVNGLFGINDTLILQVYGEMDISVDASRKFLQIFMLSKQLTKKYYVQTEIFQWVDKIIGVDKSAHVANSNIQPQHNAVQHLNTATTVQRRQPDEESICSFDEADNLHQAKISNNGGNIAPPPLSPTRAAFKHAMKRVFDRIAKVINANGLNRLTPMSRLPLEGFCNSVVQVIGTMNSEDGISTYMRVADGTMPEFRTGDVQIKKLAIEKWNVPSCNVDIYMNELLEPCVIDILCYDEFKEAATRCSPGDIVYLCNLRVQKLLSFYFVKMSGGGKMHGRSFTVLEAVPNVEEIETIEIDFEEDEAQDIKYPIPESVIGSPCNKRPRLEN